MWLNTKDELFEAAEEAVHTEDIVGDEYGNNTRVIVFQKEGKYWWAEYDYNKNEGVQWYGPINCREVVQREIIKKVWVPV